MISGEKVHLLRTLIKSLTDGERREAVLDVWDKDPFQSLVRAEVRDYLRPLLSAILRDVIQDRVRKQSPFLGRGEVHSNHP